MHLEKILARTRADLRARKLGTPVEALREQALAHQPRGFARALCASAVSGPAVLAEIKRASPSKGMIRPDFRPADLARSLAEGGAAALSVLTDEPFFQGSLAFLKEASESSGLPCLRKDFIVDPYQIVEARAWGADAILLIAAALEDGELESLNAEARSWGLDVLCEVHTRAELERVKRLGCECFGVNNRDLVTFQVRLEISLELAAELPMGAVKVAESGLSSCEDLLLLRKAGYDAFLIGESLMRAADPGLALRELLLSCGLPASQIDEVVPRA